ncbi:permease prefix domain 1-containing protein [Kribbella sp. CA-247076]|uniref:permease prefix domain 1-containing protein n=1 Tax=Kribbella sp. CA-247076 TaxID=3239941 RepID=UPI003D8DCBA7
MSSRASTVDEYLTGLSRALPGPRRRKADLLAEARDHLADATEALEADGLDRAAAERAAVADFGALDEIVPGYRAELAVSQSRRTATMLFLVLIIQPIVWQEGAWSWNRDPDAGGPLNDVLQALVQGIGMVAMAGAVLAVIAGGVGLRYPVVRDHVSRFTGLFAIGCSAAISLIGVGMATTGPGPGNLLDYGIVTGFVVLPLLGVGLQAGRTLRLARA